MSLDPVSITPGTGVDIATDTVGGLQVQVVKPAFGGDGVATMVSASSPLPVTGTVTISDGSGPVTVDGTTPAGVTSTLGAPSNPSTGVYTIAYTVAALGEYEWWAVGAGSNAVADRGSFRVTQAVPADTP